MIWGAKNMTAGCIERMSGGGCGDCVRRDPCTFIWKELFGFDSPGRRCGEREGKRSEAAPRNPFLAFLGEVTKAIERKAKPRETPFREEVERQVEPLLALGPIRIDAVARVLGYSRQTLYRRIKTEGVTFGQLVDGIRRRLALRFLRDEGLSVKEAAYRLGFSDPAAFSRAFKRWTGQSPRAMRRDQPG